MFLQASYVSTGISACMICGTAVRSLSFLSSCVGKSGAVHRTAAMLAVAAS